MSQHRRGQPSFKPGFPSMSVDELCDCLFALGISAHVEDLHKPNPQSAQAIYAGLLDALMSANVESMEQPKAALMGLMEYKDLYADALSFTMFFRHLWTLARICGVEDFNMNDVTRPEGQRFKHVLSGIMNFAKFRDERLAQRDVLQQRLVAQSEKTERLRKQLDSIETKISEIAAKNAQDRPKTEEARKRNDQLRSELFELRSQQIKLSHDVEEVKREKDAVFQQAAGKGHELSTLQLQVTSTRSRLVQSPDRIKRHISEMSSSVAAEKATLSNFQRKGRELGNRLEVIGGLEMDLKGLIDLSKGIDAQRGKLEEARRGMLGLNRKLEVKKIESQGLSARLEQLDRQLQNASDKLVRQQNMSKDMQVRAAEKIEALKAQYVVKAKERGVWQKEREHLLAEQKALEEEMASFVARHEGEINELLQEYWNMRRQAEDYMSTMTVQLGLKVKA